ncbi:MAG: hypothetical protein ACXABY_04245 [Candidatus Thorarchaeota archaeon]|jgi:hypothetical protein
MKIEPIRDCPTGDYIPTPIRTVTVVRGDRVKNCRGEPNIVVDCSGGAGEGAVRVGASLVALVEFVAKIKLVRLGNV